jgi:hypothetical protein
VKLNYFWTDCADGSHVAVNYTVHEESVTGSIRQWSRDRSRNVGRKFDVPAAELGRSPRGHPVLRLDGVCDGPIAIELPAALREA